MAGSRNQNLIGSDLEKELLRLQQAENKSKPKSTSEYHKDTYNVSTHVDNSGELTIKVDLNQIVPAQKLTTKSGKARTTLTVAQTEYNSPFDKGVVIAYKGKEYVIDASVFKRIR